MLLYFQMQSSMFCRRTAKRTSYRVHVQVCTRAQQQGQNDDRLHSGIQAGGRAVPLLAVPKLTWVSKKRCTEVTRRTQTRLTEKDAAGTLHVETNGTSPRRTG